MITITEKPEPPTKVKVGMLKQGDTFVLNDNKLYIVGSTGHGTRLNCVRLGGGKDSGHIEAIEMSTLVLQVNLLVEITRL